MGWDIFETSPTLDKLKGNRKKMLAEILRSKAECEVGSENAPSACVYLFERTSMANRISNLFRKNKRCDYVVVFVRSYNIAGFVRAFLQKYSYKKPVRDYDDEKLVLALLVFSAQYEYMRYLPQILDLDSPRLTRNNVLREYENLGSTVKIGTDELALARLEGHTYYQRLWDNL